MNRHPGGEEHTKRLLEHAALPKGARILDMGAGSGEAVRLMKAAGYDAVGIDLAPRSEIVLHGDCLRTGFPDRSFDAVLSQCAFFLSGDQDAAIREAKRLLKPGGSLMLSDVFFEEPMLPGFCVAVCEDMTPQWREYYLEALWREEIDCDCFPRGKCRYLSVVAVKTGNHSTEEEEKYGSA